jgi:dephospho-CoA kinase
VAICAGWRQNKTPKHRKFLSDLKKLLKEWDDVPYRKAATEILLRETEAANNGHRYDSVLFIHCREPEEIERFVQDFGAKTLLLKRDSADNREQSNDSDSGVMEYNYDIVIENNDSLEKLQQKAEAYVKEILMFDRKEQ